MTTCAVMMVRNEADIIETSVRNLLAQVDEVIVADNLSTDATFEILMAIQDENERLIVTVDDEVGYWQSSKMTALAHQALRRGHSWLIPADADEIWQTYELGGLSVAQALESRRVVYGRASAAVFNHYASVLDILEKYEPNPCVRLQWRTVEPLGLPKMAVRLHAAVVVEPGNHGATPHPSSPRVAEGLLQVRHFPYRSPEQFVAKALQGRRAVEAADLDRTTCLHWREYGERIEAEGEEAGGHAWFERYFRYRYPEVAGTPRDPEPDLGLARVIFDPVRL